MPAWLRLPLLFTLAVVLIFGVAIATLAGTRATVGWLAGTAALVFLWHGVERPTALARSRKRLGLCESCGYDLTGNVSGVCPECGAAAPAGPPTAP